MSYPYCGNPLTNVTRRYPCSIVCYGHERMGPDGMADYVDQDCTNPECPCVGTIFSPSGGIGFGSCFICRGGLLISLDRAELHSAVKLCGNPHKYHIRCRDRLLEINHPLLKRLRETFDKEAPQPILLDWLEEHGMNPLMVEKLRYNYGDMDLTVIEWFRYSITYSFHILHKEWSGPPQNSWECRRTHSNMEMFL